LLKYASPTVQLPETEQTWSIHPAPFADEVLESWLTRLSRANFVPFARLIRSLRLQEFLEGQLFGTEGALKNLAQRSGVSMDRILEMHLITFAERTEAAFGNPYQIPARASKDSLHYFKLCPQCLSDPAQAYARIFWALDITCFCPIHQSVLRATCQACGSYFSWSPLQPHDLLRTCRQCGADVTATPTNLEPAKITAIEFQARLLRLKRDELVQISGSLALTGMAFAQIIQRLFHHISDTPCQFLLYEFADVSFQESVCLLDDRFSLHRRRTNALSVIAWLLEALNLRATALRSHLRRHTPRRMPSMGQARLDQAIGRVMSSFRSRDPLAEGLIT
jgi:hypothetical protein